jgi:ubiquinone/menaquinone biosynthesis C-methylase UbiE
VVAPGEVTQGFDEVADRYDFMVALNPGYHRHLRIAAEALVAQLERGPVGQEPAPLRLVDLGCGSGASTRALVAAVTGRAGPWRLLAVDASPGMLRRARARSWPPGVEFVEGAAERLADLPQLAGQEGNAQVDGVLAAYLVRNVPQRDALLRSLHDLLRPGGVLVVHDYSVAGNLLASIVWTLVCWGVVVPLGWLTSRHTRLYRYLWRSALDMDTVDVLSARLRAAGFVEVSPSTVRGWQHGILHTITARRDDLEVG